MTAWSYIKIGFSAIFAVYAVYEKFMLPELQIPFLVSVIFSAIFYFFTKYLLLAKGSTRSHKISYSMFAFFLLIGDSFKKYSSFAGIWGNHFRGTDLAVQLFEDYGSMLGFLNGPAGNLLTILSAVCKLIGYYYIILYTVECGKYFLLKKIFHPDSAASRIANHFLNQKAFLRMFIVLLAAWLPYLICKFPGSVCNDARGQVVEFMKSSFSAVHPLYVTLLFGSFAALGDLLGNQDIGLFIYLVLQCCLMACVFAYCIVATHSLHKNTTVSLLLLALFAFSPAFPSNATTLIKDTLYCTAFVLYITELIFVIHEIENGAVTLKHTIRTAVAALLLCLTRNNGIVMVLPTMAVLFVLYILNRRTLGKQMKVVPIIILLPLVVYLIMGLVQDSVTTSKGATIGEILSIPFQQTARYVRENADSISEEEAKVIDAVLDYENLAQLYNPIVSDPVKGTYKGDADALPMYFRVWLEQGKKDPVTYIEAMVETNYFLLYPDEPNIRAYCVMDDSLTHFTHPILKATRMLLLVFVMGLSLVPIISCLINPVYYIWGFVYIFVDSIFKKHHRYIFLLLLPLLLQLINVLLGPAVFNQPRYFYPVYWAMPFVLVFTYREKLATNEQKV
ncbi:MAG: DUF6020 family protein [Ruminococcus sp.]|nr:DUF6020 family protein [Ruminococcus sp.]